MQNAFANAFAQHASPSDSQQMLRNRLVETRRVLQRWRRSNRAFQKHCESLDHTHETALLHNTDALADLEAISMASQAIEAEFTNAVTQLQLATDLLMRARTAVAAWQQASEDARAALQAAAVAHQRTTERINALTHKVPQNHSQRRRWQQAKDVPRTPARE